MGRHAVRAERASPRRSTNTPTASNRAIATNGVVTAISPFSFIWSATFINRCARLPMPIVAAIASRWNRIRERVIFTPHGMPPSFTNLRTTSIRALPRRRLTSLSKYMRQKRLPTPGSRAKPTTSPGNRIRLLAPRFTRRSVFRSSPVRPKTIAATTLPRVRLPLTALI